MEIYLDNASTTFPKPKIVADSIYNYLVNIGGNANRGNYSNSLEGDKELFLAREKICNFFDFDKVSNVIFTNNVTSSLNILIRGLAKEGSHFISSTMDHNSTLRPLFDCKDNNGIELSLVEGDTKGFIDIAKLSELIQPNTRAIILSHGSNVTGSIQNLEAVGALCKKNNIFFIIDSAQTAGSIKIDMQKLNANAIAFTGHKSLLGPRGIGGFIIDDSINSECTPLISGGTGSLSHLLHQPDFLPDKFESGTLNMPGIIGLSRAIDFINEVSLDEIHNKLYLLRKKLIDGLLNINGITVYGDITCQKSTTCVSINYKDYDPAELSFYLSENGIKTRSGLHCAPLAHKSIGTFPGGTTRLSVGYFNTEEEIDYTLSVLNSIRL